tara:strand:+ start:936 stop:2657 length:1722 start_codon:yes stop_codon:yes gene_type:complete
MAVNAPPTRRPALTRLDEELLARLLQQAQTPQEAYTRESALGVPWGSLANSLVGGMLAGRERRRQEEKIKRQDDYADAVTRITSMGTNLMPGQVSISPQGTFETLPTDVEGGGVSTFTRPDILQSQQQIDTLRNDPEMMERLRSRGVEVPMVGSEFEATTEAPLGIPYAPQAATVTVGEEFPEDSNELTRFLSGKEEPVTLDQNANVALSQALRGAGYEPLEYMQYMQNQKLLNAKKPPEYKPMGGELTLYNKNTNQEIRAQRYLVVNSDGTTSNVLMNIQTGELEQDPNQFTFEKPEEGSFTYDSGLTDVLITTPNGGVPAKAQMQYDHEGAMTGMAVVNGELVKVSTLNYKKVDALQPFQVEDFEMKVNKDWKDTPIVKTYNDASNQIGKLNAIRDMQVTLKDKPEEFAKFVKNTLGLSKNTLASFEKSIEESGDAKAVSAGIMDWATIFLFNKMLDEDSVVRDPEVKQTMNSAGFSEGIATWLQGLEDGEKIGEQVRQGISITANIMFKSIEDRYKNELKTNADRIAIWKSRDNPATNELSYQAILGNSIKLIDPEGLLYNNGNPWEEDK